MIWKLLPMCLMAFITVSCDTDFEDVSTINDSSQKQIENNSVVKYEDLFSESTNVAKVKTRASHDEIVEDELVVVYGSDRTTSVKKAKVAINSTSAAKFGLQQGVYVVEYLLCYKNVYKPGYDIWYEESEKCGYKPSQDFVLGNSSIAMTKERGYEVPESNAKEIKTFVLHVISDLSGRKLDKYDPCAPKDIEWKYSISPQ